MTPHAVLEFWVTWLPTCGQKAGFQSVVSQQPMLRLLRSPADYSKQCLLGQILPTQNYSLHQGLTAA